MQAALYASLCLRFWSESRRIPPREPPSCFRSKRKKEKSPQKVASKARAPSCHSAPLTELHGRFSAVSPCPCSCAVRAPASHLRARRFVGSVTRRRGGPPAHRPSGRGPGCGYAPDRAIPPPSQAGVGFGSGSLSDSFFWSRPQPHEIKLRRKQGPTGGGGGVFG